jgi:hypothetical protein
MEDMQELWITTEVFVTYVAHRRAVTGADPVPNIKLCRYNILTSQSLMAKELTSGTLRALVYAYPWMPSAENNEIYPMLTSRPADLVRIIRYAVIVCDHTTRENCNA